MRLSTTWPMRTSKARVCLPIVRVSMTSSLEKMATRYSRYRDRQMEYTRRLILAKSKSLRVLRCFSDKA